jgi:hypothetical protein
MDATPLSCKSLIRFKLFLASVYLDDASCFDALASFKFNSRVLVLNSTKTSPSFTNSPSYAGKLLTSPSTSLAITLLLKGTTFPTKLTGLLSTFSSTNAISTGKNVL